MADFNPKTIKGNIGGVYFTKTKEAVDPFNLTKYNPNTNQNIILFHLEDGVENNIVTVNFAPNDSSMPKKGWTSHDFPAIFRGYVDHTVNGEAIPRTFAQYLALVPTLITDLNLNNKKPLSFNATVIQQSGVNLLGSFNTLNDLINAHTPTESLHDNDAIAYVYENGQNGYYKVYFSSGSSTWYWGLYQGAISTSLSEVQYNLTGLQVQGGFRNPAPIVPLQDEQYRIIWQYLNELYAQDSVIEGELGELEQEIIELNTAVVKTISKTDTNTIIIGLTRIDNNVNIHAVVNVSSNSYNLLKVVGSDGLEVNPEDIINEIIFEINNTNSALRQAIDDIVDNKITAHNTNSEAHQDIRSDIETAEQNANEYTDLINEFIETQLTEEVIRVEQKVDTHIEDLNNPHGVTAEQVDTYTKLVIDNKDANTLQEAKDYTYSKVEIDNKDTAIMNKANNLENANMFKDVNYNNQNGVLMFTKYDNTTKEIDLPLELLVESGYYDEVANELVLVLANSSEIRIPVGNLLTDLDAHNIRFNGSGTNYLTAKTKVESAVKELDTRVKANADDKVDKVTGKALSTNDYTNTDKQSVEKIPTIEQDILDLESNKVDKVAGKGLSTNDYTTTEKNKLSGIASGAEVNVQSDWNATSGDALILNKPIIPTNVSQLNNDSGYITGYTETDPIFTAWDKSTGINITKSQVTDLIEATQALSGLMSATDKQRLDVLHALLEEDEENSVVDSINEVLAIFNNYPEGADLVTALADKVDKVSGKGLSTNDFTNNDKNKLDGIEAGAEVNPYSKTQLDNMFDEKVDKVAGMGLSTNDYTTTEKNKLSGIASGAEVNVQSDWNATSGDALILNKPIIPTNVSQLNNDSGYITGYTETDPIFTAWDKSTGISITKSQISDLLEATQALSGLMSAMDKQRLDVLHALLEEDTENNVVDSINEVLAIFNNYPEGADLVTALAGKVDKVSGKGLSTNDLTDILKSNYDTAYSWGNHATENYLKSITKAMVEAVLTGTITTHNHDSLYYTEDETDTLLNSKVDKVAGKGLSTEDYTTNEKNKLAGIASGAEVNVQSDWTQEDNTADDYIKNKPAIPTKVSDLTNDSEFITTETDPIFTAWDKSTGINITKSQVTDLIEATQALSGLMSATDKQRLDVLHALLEEDTENNVVDSINEVLAIFNNYPEGADLVTALADKVDKVSGKGLSTNDFTNNDKNKLDGIEAGAEVNPYSKTQLDNMFDEKVDKVAGMGLSTNDYTTTEKNKLSGIASGAEVNVQSDWNATSGDALILNKPIIPTNVSQLNNDSGYITGYTETDPIFTAWDKSTGINITKSQVTDLIEATQALSGLMSATDKQRLDVLHALLEEDEENSVVDSINEVLAIFNNYPEGADLVTALADKVDKVSGKGLSTNDFTNNDKNKLDGIEAGAEVNPYSKTQLDNMFDEKVDKVAGMGLSTNDYTTTEKNKLSGIASGAEVNVQSDWNATSGDALILNKPIIPTNVSQLNNDSGYITGYTETDPIFTAWDKSTGISITKSQISDLLEATQALSGLMSAMDKQRLDVLHALLEEDTENNVVDSINEVLAIFNNYPEGADLVTALAGKVDKVSGKGLSTNDLTDILKSNYDTAYSWGNHATENYLKSITKAMVEAVLTGTITTHNHDSLYYTEDETDTLLNSKVDKVAGKGLSTEDYTTNEKNKLAGIASGAEVNVQSDWTQEDNTADDYIKNKPAIPTKVSDLTNDSEFITTETDPIFTAWDKSTGINITKSQVTDLIEATQALSGLMSATDKQRLDVLHALLEEDTENNVVDSINEVLAIFNNYPEGADLVTALADKVDKVSGKGLSTNDFTNNDKNKLDGIEAGAEVNPYSKTQLDNMFDEKVDKVAGMGLSTNDYTTTEKNKLSGIASGAEVNVQSDWNATSGDALILNKPIIPTNVSQLNNDSGYITGYTETDPIFTAWDKSTGISITKSQISDLLEATQALSGLMSATDKQRLDVLHALLEEDEENSVVDSINEVLAIFNNYPEGADLVTALADKVDKVSGKGLSTNDFTNNDKNKLDGIEAGAEVNPYSKTQLDNMFDEKVDKVAGMGLSSNDFTTTEKNKLSGIQAGAQVNAVTTVAGRTGAVVLTKADVGLGSVQNYGISSQAQAIAGTVNTVYMTPLRTKEAITAAMGDIESALDAILGV